MAARAILLTLVLAGCAGQQRTLCDLSMGDLQAQETKELISVSRECSDYPELLDCPEAASIAAKYRAVWSEWERCGQ